MRSEEFQRISFPGDFRARDVRLTFWLSIHGVNDFDKTIEVGSDDAALKKAQVGSRFPGNRVYVTPALIVLNVIVFGLMVGNGVPALEPAPHSMLDWGADFGLLTLGGQWWRMLSSIFLHKGNSTARQHDRPGQHREIHGESVG